MSYGLRARIGGTGTLLGFTLMVAVLAACELIGPEIAEIETGEGSRQRQPRL